MVQCVLPLENAEFGHYVELFLQKKAKCNELRFKHMCIANVLLIKPSVWWCPCYHGYLGLHINSLTGRQVMGVKNCLSIKGYTTWSLYITKFSSLTEKKLWKSLKRIFIIILTLGLKLNMINEIPVPALVYLKVLHYWWPSNMSKISPKFICFFFKF